MSAPAGLVLPPDGVGLPVIVSASGGKDSTALILALREAEIPCRYVFADTGWEAPETYEYLELLRAYLGITIDVVRAAKQGEPGLVEPDPAYSAMVERIRVRAGFPGRTGRFCTREIKIEPLRDYHDRVIEELGVDDSVSAIGVRNQESDERAKITLEWEDEGPTYTRERWGGYVWRPLLRWSVEDVLRTHTRHGVPVNPLYLKGHDRVGCYPCIFENKEGIELVAKHAPWRIDQIRELELETNALRRARNLERPGRYALPDSATFFQTRNGRRKRLCRHEHTPEEMEQLGKLAAEAGYHAADVVAGVMEAGARYHLAPFIETCEVVRGLVEHTPMNIDQIVAWARTDTGGKQYSLFERPPQGGCMRWGLCETSPSHGEDER